jgi:hypothetical protein
MKQLLYAAWVLLGLPALAAAQDRYVLLATTLTGTMQQEINIAASKGYRVIAASRTEGQEAIVTLERSEDRYEYRLVATTRTGTLQRELNEAVEAGYRVIPRAVTTKRTSGGSWFGNQNNNRDEGELLVVMEKGTGRVPGLAYQVLATSRTATLQKEMSETADRGFTLVALVSRGEHIAIFERTGQ